MASLCRCRENVSPASPRLPPQADALQVIMAVVSPTAEQGAIMAGRGETSRLADRTMFR